MKAQLKIVFLDVNGTAVDDWDAQYAAMCAVFNFYGVQPPTIEEHARMIGENTNYKKYYEEHGITAERDELYKHWLPAYKDNEHLVRTVPGLTSLTTILKDAGIEIHLLSAARGDAISAVVEKAGLGDGICDAYHYHAHDKAAQIRAVVHGSSYAPNECVMIGDIPSDMQACHETGIHGIHMYLSQAPALLRENTQDIGCMDYASNFHDVLRILRHHFEL